MSALSEIIQRLDAYYRETSSPYFVPGLWVDGETTAPIEVNPFAFYSQRLSEIYASEPQALVQGNGGGDWSRHAIIYNLFPRLTAAFDHNNDGSLAPNADGWRETGTLLKCIALLPYIRSMGFNTVHLLPITTIGQDGKKGTLGSPYAIRNPYQMDNNLIEPVLELNIDHLFAGFVEAAHRLGLRVVLEFVLRTGARDSDWIHDHPDWFYWIRADTPDRIGRGTGRLNVYGNPIFSSDTLGLIKSKVGNGDFHNLPTPSTMYRALFTVPPRPDQVFMENGRYFGTLDDGTKVRIPGAFTDWPPDDNQPPWTDVTYLRMFNHPDFNYMAYNTIRMYDNKLATPENCNWPLWDAIAGVIPHYQHGFGIDGVMIDMGHALPRTLKQRIVGTAREINSDFAFWDENFSITQFSKDEGYNAVMGWMVLNAHEADNLRHLIHEMRHSHLPISFFAAPENHNTPRTASRPGGLTYAHYILALTITLPAMPFILSGFELGETQPINTGLGFNNEQLAHYPADKLPLFSERAFDWSRPRNMVTSVRYALSLRHKYEAVFNNTSSDSFVMGYSDNPRILVFSRCYDDQWISIIANTDQHHEQRGRVALKGRMLHVSGLWGTSDDGMDIYEEKTANVSLVPGYVLIVDGQGVLNV
ncbi:MAG: alpha-amylase [Chloroflexota bacterium]